jgi:hypothetical protein
LEWPVPKSKTDALFFSLHWRARFVYALTAAVGLLLMSRSVWDFKHLVSSAGHALLIAGLLALTVDGFARKHIIQEVSRDIYQFLIGHGLPQALQHKIRDVMTISLVHLDTLIRYRLEPLAAGRVRLHVVEEWRVRNYAGSHQPYTTHLGAEEYEKLIVKNVECHGASVEGYTLSGDDLDMKPRPEKKGSVWAYGKEVRVPPGDSDVRVVWRYSVEPPESSNVHAWALPVVDVRVEIEPCPGYEFSVVEADQAIGNTWIIRKAFMPGQSIRVRWFRKDAQPDNAPNAAV